MLGQHPRLVAASAGHQVGDRLVERVERLVRRAGLGIAQPRAGVAQQRVRDRAVGRAAQRRPCAAGPARRPRPRRTAGSTTGSRRVSGSSSPRTTHQPASRTGASDDQADDRERDRLAPAEAAAAQPVAARARRRPRRPAAARRRPPRPGSPATPRPRSATVGVDTVVSDTASPTASPVPAVAHPASTSRRRCCDSSELSAPSTSGTPSHHGSAPGPPLDLEQQRDRRQRGIGQPRAGQPGLEQEQPRAGPGRRASTAAAAPAASADHDREPGDDGDRCGPPTTATTTAGRARRSRTTIGTNAAITARHSPLAQALDQLPGRRPSPTTRATPRASSGSSTVADRRAEPTTGDRAGGRRQQRVRRRRPHPRPRRLEQPPRRQPAR